MPMIISCNSCLRMVLIIKLMDLSLTNVAVQGSWAYMGGTCNHHVILAKTGLLEMRIPGMKNYLSYFLRIKNHTSKEFLMQH